MNNLNQNPDNILNFQMRYLIKERQEKLPSSWCSTGNETTTVRSKPVLQYSTDDITWLSVPTVIEKD